MNPSPLHTVGSFLHSEWRGPNSSPNGQDSGPFVTISREAGSGGSSFAALVARKLNAESPDGILWRVYEGNLIGKMLEENHLSPDIARHLPEKHISESQALIGELVGLHPSLWELVQKINATMRNLATEGHVILVGRGANFATAGISGGTHVRLVAPPAHRAQYLVQRYNVAEREAVAYNKKCEAARRRYVKDHFGANVNDATAYSMVINTAAIPLPEAADLVCRLVCRNAATKPAGQP